jgi:DHA2 family multidrug resistance protein
MIAASVMLATFMVVLDSSVANVALPHIAGNLSASTDESTWILTSYLVSNAIMLPATGWLTRRIGRKRLLMASILLFTFASMLCGLAVNMPMLLLARILQGLGGGGMLPLAQAILLESFPPEQHGMAMAVYGVGVVVAPVIGPTLGGWITDSFSWRWIFFINLPVGLAALLMAQVFIEDPAYLKRAARGVIDALGFVFMAVWVGALQMILDKGQEADWFEATWIRWLAVLAAAALIAFLYRESRHPEPIVHLRVFRDRNFTTGAVMATVNTCVLYGVTAMLPLFLQILMGYPALQSGLAVSPRGFGSILSMLVVGRLADRVDGRLLVATGFTVLGTSALLLGRISLGMSMATVVWPNILNGFASGFIFVPLITMSMSRLPREEIGNAAGIYNLMRNLGGSIGIASIMTLLVRGTQAHRTILVAHLVPGNPVMGQWLSGLEAKLAGPGGLGSADAPSRALGLLDRLVQQQATYAAYVDNFRMLGWLALLCIPLVLFFRRGARKADAGAAAMAD